MHPVYSTFGQLVGWLSGNVIFSANGKNIAFVRGENVYTPDGWPWGRISRRRGRLIWDENGCFREQFCVPEADTQSKSFC